MPTSCTRDSDCPQGYTCFEDGCASTTQFAIRIHPNRDDLTIQDFYPVSVTSNRIDLILSAPSIIQGTLRVKKGNQLEDFSEGFQMESRGESTLIPGLSFSSPIVFRVESNSSRYSFPVPAGKWSISVYPFPTTIPPLLKNIELATNSAIDPDLILNNDVQRVKGTLVKKTSWPETPNHFRYQVLEANSLMPLSQQQIFATNTPFEVPFTPWAGQLLLRVTPTSNEAPSVLPSKDFPSTESGTFTIRQFSLGDIGEPQTVKGTVVAPSSAPLVDADIRLEGITGDNGRYSTSVRTDSEGQFSAQLLPSAPDQDYLLTLYPPSDSACSTTFLSFAVGRSTLNLPEIRCPAKSSLRGVIRNVKEEPLAGIAVRIEPDQTSKNPGRSVVRNLVTDANGAYFTLVEPGSYRLVAMPPVARKLPWGAKLVTIEGPTQVVSDIVLSQGHRIQGSIGYSPDKNSHSKLNGATIAIYSIPVSGTSPIKVYETLTNDQGEFEAILPAGEEQK